MREIISDFSFIMSKETKIILLKGMNQTGYKFLIQSLGWERWSQDATGVNCPEVEGDKEVCCWMEIVKSE